MNRRHGARAILRLAAGGAALAAGLAAKLAKLYTPNSKMVRFVSSILCAREKRKGERERERERE